MSLILKKTPKFLTQNRLTVTRSHHHLGAGIFIKIILKEREIMKETYFGFTDNLKPMQKAKVEKSLDILIRFDDGDKEKVSTNKEFVYNRLKKGCKPEYEEDYSYYSPRLDDFTKPRTLYKLVFPNNSTFNEINKTLYNYALYLLENDYIDEQKSSAFIDNEKKAKEESQRLEQERIKKEREGKQRIKEQEEKERKERFEKKQKQWMLIGENLLQNMNNNPITTVLDQHWETMKSMFTDLKENNDTTYSDLVQKYTVMLGNQGLCAHRSQYYVECENKDDGREYTLEGNPTMFLEKEILFKTFNIQLIDKPTTITAKVKAIFEGREYKGSKPIELETFYYFEDAHFIECKAQPISIEGMDFFIYSNYEKHFLYEARSGGKVWNNASKSELIKTVKEKLKNNKSTLQSNVNLLIKKNGLSPRYHEDIKFDEKGQGVLF